MSSPPSKLKGRGNLPGIPAYVDRASAERIWADFCNSEQDYLRHCAQRPPKVRENYGAMHGFEIVRCASYMKVIPVKPGAADASTRGFKDLAAEIAAEEAQLALRTRPRSPAGIVTPGDPLVLPKYTRFSGDHMLPMEVAPNSHKSAQALARAMSTTAIRPGL
eukprot:CAMPEP_0194761368 /NCGR_PEP_ID=MMETSP0323_2-20130528/14088_1 /TAXON_ID=2866 ORGANISM="Crypthecodinium cohnii, Strain Seligo" /NCGR_SAMPLE_ID=MMETSP0323_2 /ASSEMBLY_ACC=CAM_ASM_000346 /LENGTH=162 /DNA_ID=CAMNT_0039683073 /DNA_START=42 /DNA_END=530 /DNA_ORIENTATION=+